MVELLLAAILVAIILCDVRMMRIPDLLTMLALFTFVLRIWTVGLGPWLLPQIALGGVVFALCLIAFALRLMGGGDTKMLPALALFVPVAALPSVLFAFSAALLLSIGAILLARRRFASPDHGWAVLRSTALPMGLPIGLAGLVSLGFG